MVDLQTTYRELDMKCGLDGLDRHEIARSANELSRRDGPRRYLAAAAYAPTGIVLGHPLPDDSFAALLGRTCDELERCLTALCPGTEAPLARVPCDAYHISLLSRSHFDKTAPASITYLSEAERRRAECLLTDIVTEPVAVDLRGILLVREGRLLIPGIPEDDRLDLWRSHLAAGMPELARHVHRLAHIKIAHLAVHLESEQLQQLRTTLATLAARIRTRLTFRDLFTPAGRVSLGR